MDIMIQQFVKSTLEIPMGLRTGLDWYISTVMLYLLKFTTTMAILLNDRNNNEPQTS